MTGCLESAAGSDCEGTTRARRFPWSQRRGRRVSWRLRVARARAGSASAADRRELMASSLRMLGVLGMTALLRAEIDNDGDVIVLDTEQRPVAMVRPALDGSLVRVF
jgi:hypothetical protein